MMLETDYLIVGSGAMGMAFADVLVTETDATIIIVDRYGKPGGHWNHAYPFVTLHQPSAFYGVSSKELSKGKKDKVGLNKGLNDLASGAEIMAYFDEVMRHQFLPTGRVQYFPNCDYKGDGKFVSMISGEEFQVDIKKKLVDATHLNTSVPSIHTPNYTIEDGVNFMPLNDLPKIKKSPEGYVIIGGGKTGIDACLWLLENRVKPEKITWIVSRDAWLIDRKNAQPTIEFFEDAIGSQARQFEALANATSVDDLFQRLEDAGVLLRIDTTVKPQMFHGATISQLELKELRKIKNVIRNGRVKHLGQNQIEFVNGKSMATSSKNVHIDCSASAITNLSPKPIFAGKTITPQTVRSYQPVFSAAFIAHVEAAYDSEEKKNFLCQVVPLPNHDTDWIRMMKVFMMNQYNWSQDKELKKWLRANRLDGFSQLVSQVVKDNDEEKITILKKMKASMMPAVIKIQHLMEEIEAEK